VAGQMDERWILEWVDIWIDGWVDAWVNRFVDNSLNRYNKCRWVLQLHSFAGGNILTSPRYVSLKNHLMFQGFVIPWIAVVGMAGAVIVIVIVIVIILRKTSG
jgi:hypothetical protein